MDEMRRHQLETSPKKIQTVIPSSATSDPGPLAEARVQMHVTSPTFSDLLVSLLRVT